MTEKRFKILNTLRGGHRAPKMFARHDAHKCPIFAEEEEEEKRPRVFNGIDT
jgi:hypothetical protein